MTDSQKAFISCFFSNFSESERILRHNNLVLTKYMFSGKCETAYITIHFFIDTDYIFSPSSFFSKYREIKPTADNSDALFIAEVLELSESPAHLILHANAVIKDYKVKIFRDILRRNYTRAVLPEDILDRVCREYEMATQDQRKNFKIKTHNDIASDFVEEFIRKQEEEVKGGTGWCFLDEHIYFDKKMIMFVGGNAGVGKTTFLMQVLQKYGVAYGVNSLLISLEMPAIPLFRRNIITVAASKKKYVDVKTVCEEDPMAIKETADYFSNVLICDEASLSVYDIEKIIIKAKKLHNVEFVGIDYIGYIRSDEKKIVDAQAKTARELKQLAKRQNIRLIVLSQLNRETDEFQEPALRALKDTGAIEESGDIVILLWGDANDPNIINGKIAKNREGERTKFKLTREATFLEEKI